MGMGMKSLKWEGIGTKNLFPHTSSVRVTYHYRGRLLEKTPGSLDWPPVRNLFFCADEEWRSRRSHESQLLSGANRVGAVFKDDRRRA